MLSRIKKDDTVVVLSGKNKGKQGQVIKVDQKKGVVIVKNVGLVTKHLKAKKTGEKSKIVKEESPFPLCKLMPICSFCKKTCRVQVRFLEDGGKSRVCGRCKEAF
jgi:large subunit ribosomal protein L24